MSMRNVAITYGIPARAVARAIENGELPAIKLITETGRERLYVSTSDADLWVSSLLTVDSQLEKVQN
jgi:hypothetical protein